MLLLCIFSLAGIAQIRIPKILGSNMVLQQKQVLPIWGWATPGKTVLVRFGNQQLKTIAAKDSSWRVNLAPMPANNNAQSMTISCDTSKVIFQNILVGEVWLCSGQSNMEYPMRKGKYKNPDKGADSAAIALAQSHPGIRIFNVQKKLSSPDVTTTGWQECEGAEFEKTSAAGFFFASKLHQKLKVPIGIIHSSWGGTRIEVWTPPTAYQAIPFFKAETTSDGFRMDNIKPGKNYQSMIKPLAPFAIRGVLWYQGESNCMIEEKQMKYAYKMQALIESWRHLWHNTSLPFYYVQIVPYFYSKRKDSLSHTSQTLPLFWEQQNAVRQIPHTGFVTTTDLVDTLSDIHPSYKWEVGKRLAALALSDTYLMKNIPSLGPEFEKMESKNGKLIIYFKNAQGLKTSNGQAPAFFSIAGADGSFVPADAVISNNTVILSNSTISNPQYASLGWTEIARINLINSAGLPAVPFRSNAEKWVYKPSKY